LRHGTSRCSACDRRRSGHGGARGLRRSPRRSADPASAAGATGAIPRHGGGGRRGPDGGGRLLRRRGRGDDRRAGGPGPARCPGRAAGRGQRVARQRARGPG